MPKPKATTPTDQQPGSLSYVDSLKMTMAGVALIAGDDQIMAATYRNALDLAVKLDAGKDLVNVYKEFRLVVAVILDFAETRRKELAEKQSGLMDLSRLVEIEQASDDSELERQIASLPPAVADDEPATDADDD